MTQQEGVTAWRGSRIGRGQSCGGSELERESHTDEQGSCHSPRRCHTAGEGHTWGSYTYSQDGIPFRGDAGVSPGRGL